MKSLITLLSLFGPGETVATASQLLDIEQMEKRRDKQHRRVA
jgi:hypothetical protein